ncbi:MAG: hypothetical protein ABIB79_04510 [archaeon]
MLNKKRGWIRIIEAAVAILIIAGTLLIVIEKGYLGTTDITQEIYETENGILKDIQLNDTLRDLILLNTTGLPIDSDSTDFPQDVNKTIWDKTPIFLECKSKICILDEICSLDLAIESDVYAKSIAIIATTEQQKFYQLKLFCWRK